MQATAVGDSPSTSKNATALAAGTLPQTDGEAVEALEDEPSAGEGEPTIALLAWLSLVVCNIVITMYVTLAARCLVDLHATQLFSQAKQH